MKLNNQKDSIHNSIIKSMIYSWNYYTMSFPQKSDFSNVQSYVPNGFIELVFLKDLQVYEAVDDQLFKKLPSAFVWGQTKAGSKIVVVGTGQWFEIKLYPWAFELLFEHPAINLPLGGGVPLQDLKNEFKHLSDQILSLIHI